MQRLPRGTIERAQVGGKIILQKHPGAAHLGPWNAPRLGPLAKLLGVEVKESRSFMKVESAHLWPPREVRAPMERRSYMEWGRKETLRRIISRATRLSNWSEQASPAPQSLNLQGELVGVGRNS